MKPTLAALARRWISAFGVVACLAALPTPTTAQPAAHPSLVADVDRVGALIRDGRNLDAVDLAKQIAAAAPPSERQFIYQWAGWICRITLDLDCTQDILAIASPHFGALLNTPGTDRSTVSHNVLLIATYLVAIGDYQTAAKFLDGIADRASVVQDPLLLAELQLVAAQRARRVSDFETSRNQLDKALVATFSLVGPSRFDAPRLLVRIIGQLVENYDTEHALELLAASDSLLQTIPPETFLFVEFLLLRAELMAYGRDYAGAADVLQLALSKLDRLQLRPGHKLAMQVSAHNNLLGLEILRGRPDTARDLLKAHPLMAAKAEILARGYFADANEFNFALIEEYVRLEIGRASCRERV